MTTINSSNPLKIHQQWLNQMEVSDSFENRLTWLTQTLSVLNKSAVELGDNAFSQLAQENLSSQNIYEINCITFDWAEWSKMFLLLLRDALVEQQKAAIFLKDGLHTNEEVKRLWEETSSTIKEALVTIQNNFEAQVNNPKKDKLLSKRGHQENPWPIYKKQLLIIEDQHQILKQTFGELTSIQIIMQQIEIFIQETVQACLEELTLCENKVSKAVELINSNEFVESPQSIFPKLHKITEEIVVTQPIVVFKQKTNDLLLPFSERLSPIIKIDVGFVQQRDFTPKKNINQWLESEIYPLLYEIWEITESSVVGLRMVLVNLTNRMEGMHKENQEGELKDKTSLIQSLTDFQKNFAIALTRISTEKTRLDERIQLEFKLSYLFNDKEYFLPVSLQSTLNEKFWKDKNGLLAQARLWIKSKIERFQDFKEKVNKEQTLSLSEKIVENIENRQLQSSNTYYSSIFLTKGYVGESFFVGRTQEMERVEKLIANWQQEYRGAILLFGNRFSGKTIFAEIVAHRFFQNNFYRILPEQILNVKGRKIKTTFDLAAALEFVCKYNHSEKPMILIDDLELWWSPEIPFYQNIQHLTECIDLFSSRIFFIVATNTMAKKQLDCFTHFDRTFQAEIDLNYISPESLQDAISIRHGATHKKIIGEDKEVLSSKAFNKLVHQIHENALGNIGDSLTKWANSVINIDENNVECKFENNKHLPHFLNSDNTLILEILVRQKRVNEYRLRQLLGPAFNHRYTTIVRRLINVGLIVRQLDGFIELEPTIANEIKLLLD